MGDKKLKAKSKASKPRKVLSFLVVLRDKHTGGMLFTHSVNAFHKADAMRQGRALLSLLQVTAYRKPYGKGR